MHYQLRVLVLQMLIVNTVFANPTVDVTSSLHTADVDFVTASSKEEHYKQTDNVDSDFFNEFSITHTPAEADNANTDISMSTPADDVTSDEIRENTTTSTHVAPPPTRTPDVIKFGILTSSSTTPETTTQQPTSATRAPRTTQPRLPYEPCPIGCRCSAPPGVKRRHKWHNLMAEYRLRHLVYGHRPDGYGFRSDLRRTRRRPRDGSQGREMTCVGLHDFPDYVPRGNVHCILK